MLEQAIKDVGCFTDRCDDDLCVEWRVAVGHMRIELYAGVASVAGVHIGTPLAMASRAGELAVRG